MIYKEQLKQPEWHKKAALIKLRDNNCCTKCGSYSYIHVHHTYYEHGLLAWEYPDESLITLCSICHIEAHKQKIPIIRKPRVKKTPEQLSAAKIKRDKQKERWDIFIQIIQQEKLDKIDTKLSKQGKTRCKAKYIPNGSKKIKECTAESFEHGYCKRHQKYAVIEED